jgi:hypothetical protein
MKRDFSIEAYAELVSLIEQIQQEELCFITDFLGDIFLRIKHALGKHGIVDTMSDINAYHKEVLDMENTTLEELDRIFEDVSDLDNRYAGESGFYAPLEKTAQLRERMIHLSGLCARTESVVAYGGSLASCFTPFLVHVATDQRDYYEDNISLYEVEYTSESFPAISYDSKRNYVQLYEALHPEEAALLDRVLSDPDLSEAERLDIRFIIYSAPEPYRSIYLEHLSRFVIHVDSDVNGAYYMPGLEEIFIEDEDGNLRLDLRSAYNCFFHECGHAVDDFECGGVMSEEFRYEGQSLHDLLTADVRNYVEDYMRNDPYLGSLTEEQRYQVLRGLNLTDDASFAYQPGTALSDPVLEAARQAVIRHMSSDLYGHDNSAVSDVYGGVTNNVLRSTWGHPSNTYWYYGTTPTGHQEHELWAEFFAAKMTHDEKELASIRAHFPKAYEAMEAMAQQMAAN